MVNSNAERPHRLRDILNLTRSEVLECQWQLIADLLMHAAGNTDPARLSHRLQPDGDDDAVAIEVAALDHQVAQVDADAKRDASIVRDTAVRRCHLVLQLDCTATAFTALPNSTSTPSPITLTMRP